MCLSVPPSHLSPPRANPASPVRCAISKSYPSSPYGASLSHICFDSALLLLSCSQFLSLFFFLHFSQTHMFSLPLSLSVPLTGWPSCHSPFPVSHSPGVLSLVYSLPHSYLPFLSLGSPSCLYKQLSAGLHRFRGSFPDSGRTAGLACQRIHYTCALCECVSLR